MLLLHALLGLSIGAHTARLSADTGAAEAIAARDSAVAAAAPVAIADTQATIPTLTVPLAPIQFPLDAPLVASDTPHARPRAVEVSDWYARRLAIHRWVSYAVLPTFAVQWIAGNQLFHQDIHQPPEWAITTHRVGATALAGMFTVNTVTGLWNLWDSRSVPQGRWLRTFHALTMLTADAGFTWAGAKLSNEAETSLSKRRLHREVALSCMGLTVVSAAAMKIWNR